MRKRRLLLATAALSTSVACKKQPEQRPLPGNPKGSIYEPPPPIDASDVIGLPANPKGAIYDAGIDIDASAPIDAPVVHRLPANPKGTHYDAGPTKPQNK